MIKPIINKSSVFYKTISNQQAICNLLNNANDISLKYINSNIVLN